MKKITTLVLASIIGTSSLFAMGPGETSAAMKIEKSKEPGFEHRKDMEDKRPPMSKEDFVKIKKTMIDRDEAFIKNILEHKSCIERAQAPKDLKECKQIKKDMKERMKADREKFKEMRGERPHKGRE